MQSDDEIYKEVHFFEYCRSCKHLMLQDTEEPCNECLDNPVNLYSHKPVKYEEKER